MKKFPKEISVSYISRIEAIHNGIHIDIKREINNSYRACDFYRLYLYVYQ